MLINIKFSFSRFTSMWFRFWIKISVGKKNVRQFSFSIPRNKLVFRFTLVRWIYLNFWSALTVCELRLCYAFMMPLKIISKFKLTLIPDCESCTTYSYEFTISNLLSKSERFESIGLFEEFGKIFQFDLPTKWVFLLHRDSDINPNLKLLICSMACIKLNHFCSVPSIPKSRIMENWLMKM